MPALNKVQLIGRLGKDPEVRYTTKGKKYTRFSLAVDRTWKDPEGGKQEATDWFNIVAWGKVGEICAEYLKKGRLVYVEGRLRTDQWQDKETQEMHSRTVVVALSMQILDRKRTEDEVIVEPDLVATP
jgi:single-strand DNA-binding protein